MSDSREHLDLLDRQARHAAQTVFHLPVVLEAGAGTGKTAALVARVAAWCLGPGWQRHERPGEDGAGTASRVLERVAAITFTEAAAAEMAERLGAGFLAVERGELPTGFEPAAFPPDSPERRQRARLLLIALDRLRVGTIHAFCRRLLAGYPLEAGIHPRFTVDAERLAVRVTAEEMVNDWVRQSTAAGCVGQALIQLIQEGVNPEDLVELLAFLGESGVPPDALAEPLEKPDAVVGLAERLRDRASALLAVAGEVLSASGRLDKARTVVGDTGKLLDALQRLQPAGCSVAQLQEELTDEMMNGFRERLGKWRLGRLTGAEEVVLGSRQDQLACAAGALLETAHHVAGLQPGRLEAIRTAAGPLLRSLRTELRRRGIATFQDLLAQACRLLADNPEVREKERDSLDQILVDEVQDTDPLQFTLVGLLALDGPVDSRPGLFLVGDPKQSIYGWRGADLAAYEEFLERLIKAEGGQLHRLSRNFRSVPAILAAVEERIGPAMVAQPRVQPAFQSLLAHRGEDAPPWGKDRAAVEVWISWNWDAEKGKPLKTTMDPAVELEAAAVARDIRELHDRFGVSWGDVALLFRAGGRMDRYLRALQGEGIPAAAERDREFYRRREVREAIALVRCVLDSSDMLALVTVLRSAWVGVPDGALVPLWRERFPQFMTALQDVDAEALQKLDQVVERAVAAVPPDIPGIERVRGWQASVRHALRVVAHLRETAASRPLDTVVEALRATLLPEVSEAARYLGSRRVESLDRFFRWLLAVAQESGGSRHALLRLLRLARGDELPVPAGGVRDGREDAVQLLTIHKAKGLDFPVVYLVQQQAGGGGRDPESSAETVGGGWEFRLLGAATPGWDLVKERRSRVEAAELVRTLYVAATRPRDRLVLAGAWPLAKRSGTPGPPASHSDLVSGRWGEGVDTAALMAEAARLGGRVMKDETTWVFPALLSREGAAAAGGDVAVELDVAGLLDRAARVSAARAPAVERMARPWRGTVTGEDHSPASGREPPAPGAATTGRELAAVVGTAVHAALEFFPLEGPAEEGWRQAGERLAWVAAGEARAGQQEQAVRAARDLWEHFLHARLFARFSDLRPHLLAREVSVLLPPAETGPVGVVAGTVDLVYRDPDTGELVVADFKTDRVTGEEGLQERAMRYQPQLTAYGSALAAALALPAAPRLELWFLSADRVVEVS